MPSYSIEARSLTIVGGIAGHDFWVLRDENGKALAELHGLATDRQSNEFVPVGTDEDRHSLRVWHFAHDAAYAKSHGEQATTDTFIRDDQPHRTVLVANSVEVLARWNTAVKAVDPLNALDLDYPDYGFEVFGDAVNSNSTYNTLGRIMGVPVKDFPSRVEPGIDNLMLPAAEVEELRTHGFPVLKEPRIDPATPKAGAPPLGQSDLALLEKIRTGVRGLDQQAGKGWDEDGERLCASMLVLAKEKGFSPEDNLQLAFNRPTDRVAGGEILHLLRQGPHVSPDPAADRAYIATADALSVPAEDSYRQVEALGMAQANAVELAQQQELVRLNDPNQGGPRFTM